MRLVLPVLAVVLVSSLGVPAGGERSTLPAAAIGLPPAQAQVTPVTTHPRLWITANDLPRLRSWAVSGNPMYQNLLLPIATQAKEDMDAGRVPGQDTGSMQYETYPTEMYAQFFAFMSLISPSQADRDDYAARARTLLMYALNIANLGPAAGQPFRDPCFATCDSNRSRWQGEAWALTVDWIYPVLTPADKATIRTVFLRWSGEIVSNTYPPGIPQQGIYNSPALVDTVYERRWAGNNYFTAHGRNLGLMAMALDPADDPGGALGGYLQSATGAFLYMFDHLVRTDSRGGLLPEGYEYSPQTASYIAQLLLALHTAGRANPAIWGQQVLFSSNPYWDELISGFLHSASPGAVVPPDEPWLGPTFEPAWYGDGEIYNTPDHVTVFGPLGLYDREVGNTTRLSSLRWIITNMGPGGATSLFYRATSRDFLTNPILYFLLFDPAAGSGTDPRPAQPLRFFSPGLNRALARTGWDPNASLFTYKLSWNTIDHQLADGNQFEFYRRGEWLVKERTGYDLDAGSTENHNAITIQNNGPFWDPLDYRYLLWQRGSQWVYVASGDPQLLARSFGSDFVYLLGDATNLYNSIEGANDVRHASRSIIWLQPDHVVVYDRAESNTAGRFKRFWLNFRQNPVISGNRATITTASGQQLVVTSLLPAGGVLTGELSPTLLGTTALNETTRFRLGVEAPGGPQSARFLHVMQGADPGAVADTTALVRSTSGTTFEGTAVGGKTVLFPVNVGDPFAGTTYVSPNGAARQIITGLTPNASYAVTSQAVAGGTQISISAGGGYSTDAGGVLVFEVGPGGPLPTATATVGTPATTATPTRTATPTPSPTTTLIPESASLNGTVTLQGLAIGTPAYQVQIQVRLFQPGTTNLVGEFQTTTDVNGNFSVGNLPPGTYDVEVKHSRRVARIARNLTLVVGINTRAFGDLLAGDVNGDNAVGLVDYSQLRASYGRCDGDTGYRPGADFTGDSCVTLPDYSRLRANYGVNGPLDAP